MTRNGSSCPLYPRDETVLPPLRIPGWRCLGGWTLTHKSNGEHGSSDSGPGPELFLHRDCSWAPAAYPLEFLGRSSRGGLRALVSPVAMPGVPKSDRRPVWRRRRFFISSVNHSVLERSAALESLCFGIGFGRRELNYNYFYYIIVLCF